MSGLHVPQIENRLRRIDQLRCSVSLDAKILENRCKGKPRRNNLLIEQDQALDMRGLCLCLRHLRTENSVRLKSLVVRLAQTRRRCCEKDCPKCDPDPDQNSPK